MASVIFSAARVMALEKTLLSRDEINRLATFDYESIVRLLHEKNYGGENAASDDAETLIAGEMKKTRELATELAKNSCDVFFMKYDIVNLKQLVKLRLMGKSLDTDMLAEYGTVPLSLLKLMVKQWEFPSLPEIIRTALSDLDRYLAMNKDPQMVSVMLDKAYYDYAMKSCDAKLVRYFGTEADFINMIMLFRLKNIGITTEKFKEYLLCGYKISKKTLTELFESETISDEQKNRLISESGINPKYLQGVLDENTVFRLEKAKDDCLMSILREEKNDMQSIMPVIWYIVAKQRESEIIRLCASGCHSENREEKIKERLRELYG